MKRTVDTCHDNYPTATQVDEALDHASARGVITNRYRLRLGDVWVVRVDYELFDDEEDFAFASARDRDLGEGIGERRG